MHRLAGADKAIYEGRAGDGYRGYLSLIEDFPTWWIPTIKAAVAAAALHLPQATIAAYIDRASVLSPVGPYVALVRTLNANERGKATGDPPVFRGSRFQTMELVNRLSLFRGMIFESLKKSEAAEEEYRAILRRQPMCAPARWRLAHLLGARGRGAEAARILREGAGTSLFPPRWRSSAMRFEIYEGIEKHRSGEPKNEINY